MSTYNGLLDAAIDFRLAREPDLDPAYVDLLMYLAEDGDIRAVLTEEEFEELLEASPHLREIAEALQ